MRRTALAAMDSQEGHSRARSAASSASGSPVGCLTNSHITKMSTVPVVCSRHELDSGRAAAASQGL